MNKSFGKEADPIAARIMKSGPAEVLLVSFEQFPDAVKG